MPELRLPLSGDVDQTINPWTWMFRTTLAEVGRINIYMGDSSNPGLEKQILATVGTYGRQLGQIGDALRVLLRHVDTSRLRPDEREAVQALEAQLDAVDRVKRKHGGVPAVADTGERRAAE